MQQIGEGHIDLPAQWHDQSVNIFTAQAPGAQGLSITINRDRLPFGMTLDDYAKSQSGKLANQLKGYRLIEHRVLELAGSPAHEFEFTWKTDDAGPVHQILLSTAPRADGPKVVNLAATLTGRMTERQLADVRRILHSFQFNDPAGDAPSGAPAA